MPEEATLDEKSADKSDDIDTKYDEILKSELERRLKRPAKPNELINSDNDSDLVNEALWQLVKDLWARVQKLEGKTEGQIK